MTDRDPLAASVQAFLHPEPGRLIGRGHQAGDFLEAWRWDLLEERPGLLRVSCHLPDHVKNPMGQLFGGFTPTYVDLISLFAVRAGHRHEWAEGEPRWLATTSMQLDYLEPVLGPRFVVESVLAKQRGRTHFVVSRFFQDDELAVHATATMRAVATGRRLGDG